MTDNLIAWEWTALFASIYWGMILSAEYDCIRIFRRIIKHHKVWTMSLEDIIFWINAGITIFCITYELNDGIVRSFSIVGFILGAIIYRYSFGKIIVKYVSQIILFILKPLKKAVKFIKIKITDLKVKFVKKKAKGSDMK